MNKKSFDVYKSYFPLTHRFYSPKRIDPVYIRREIKGRDQLKECVEVEIVGEEYSRCADIDQITGKGRYKKGVANSSNDKKKVERTGSLGEMALSKVTGLPMAIHEKAFPFDFIVFESKKGDMKNATITTYLNYKCNFIKMWGRNPTLKSNIYISGFSEIDNGVDYAKIVLVGYMDKNVLDKSDMKPAPGGPWLNKEIPFKDTRSIRSLIDGSKNIRGTGGKLYPV